MANKNVEKPLIEDIINDFNVKATLLGLNFPETANQFQKSMLYLAHLMAILRDSVLKGREISPKLLSDVSNLASVVNFYRNEQR